MAVKRADILYEVSYEVCNKVGGIYTVVMSKAQVANALYNSHQLSKESSKGIAAANGKCDSCYIMIGPYYHSRAIGEFQEDIVPDKYLPIFNELKQLGIVCHYGTWLIKGEPKVILIDFKGFYPKLNDWKKDMWETYHIDTLNCPRDVDEPLAWSYASGLLIEKLANLNKDKKVAAQFHEWLSGAGLLYIEKQKKSGKIKNIGTVFTTHATILGRAIASNPSMDLYSVLGKIDPDKEAYNYGIPAKFQIEKQSALNATVFTTVSEITGIEAESLLGRKPDVLLPNGLDMSDFPSLEEASIKHKELKFKVKEFLLYSFFPSYSFDIDNTLLFFTFARYEFSNKGLDLFIESLGMLNEHLKKEKSDKTIVAFFYIPAGIANIKQQLVVSKRYYEDIKDSVDSDLNDIRNQMLISILSQKGLAKENIFTQDFLTEVKKKMLRFVSGEKPVLCTHDLYNEGNDAILNHFRRFNLTNKEEDKVKVVFYPTYLSGADGLINLNYYESILAGHLGVFPSAYEPWGYTPLEAGALGVASVTTDLAGFGRYINAQRPKDICNSDVCDPEKESGIYIIKRQNKERKALVEQLFNVMHHYSGLTKDERIQNKIEARKLASLADWKKLFDNYVIAHNRAVERI